MTHGYQTFGGAYGIPGKDHGRSPFHLVIRPWEEHMAFQVKTMEGVHGNLCLHICCLVSCEYMCWVFWGKLTKNYLIVCWFFQVLWNLRARARHDGAVRTLQQFVMDTLIF